uniref:Uncharacterized protein n=1 Tax=Coccolithus braarudii TaxID=221442 RepID=A0A7S0LDH2_9EUKA
MVVIERDDDAKHWTHGQSPSTAAASQVAVAALSRSCPFWIPRHPISNFGSKALDEHFCRQVPVSLSEIATAAFQNETGMIHALAWPLGSLVLMPRLSKALLDVAQ